MMRRFRVKIIYIFNSHLVVNLLAKMMPKSRFRHKRSQLQVKRVPVIQPQVRTVQIFIKNLDSHIAQSYEKLRQSKNKQYSSRKHCFLSDQKSRYEETISKDGSTMFQNTLKIVPSHKKEGSLIDTILHGSRCDQKITLLNNDQVNQYINLVYETYNISNPLQGLQETRRKIPIRNSRRTLSGTPSMRQKSSASQLKDRIVLHKDIDLTPFNANYASHRKQDSAFDFSLVSQNSKEKLKAYSSTGTKRNIDAIPQTVRIGTKKNQKSAFSQSVQPFTPQVFRYCFACEATVLQANLKHHQQGCKQLRELMDKPLESIIQLLDAKIERISKQIQVDFVQAENDKFLAEFNQLKRSVGQWVKDVKSTSNNKENMTSNSARKKMQQIQQNWGHSIGIRFEQMSKLHWFSRLRQNIKKDYHL